jgi:hypothetical protein
LNKGEKIMAVRVGRRLITPASPKVHRPHRIDFPRWRASPLYPQADAPLKAMVQNKKRMRRPHIESDKEIKRILENLGRPFKNAYNAYGFAVESASMLGQELFDILVDDLGFNWWYWTPKPSRGVGHYDYSEYHL